jgi:hypothetical protein
MSGSLPELFAAGFFGEESATQTQPKCYGVDE